MCSINCLTHVLNLQHCGFGPFGPLSIIDIYAIYLKFVILVCCFLSFDFQLFFFLIMNGTLRYLFFLQGLAATPSRPGNISGAGGLGLPSLEVWLNSLFSLCKSTFKLMCIWKLFLLRGLILICV